MKKVQESIKGPALGLETPLGEISAAPYSVATVSMGAGTTTILTYQRRLDTRHMLRSKSLEKQSLWNLSELLHLCMASVVLRRVHYCAMSQEKRCRGSPHSHQNPNTLQFSFKYLIAWNSVIDNLINMHKTVVSPVPCHIPHIN